jgi:antitoxin component of MazEF toxin-antitoxin module
MKTVTLEVANDGTLTIPVDLVRALRLSPRQTITVEAQEDTLVLVPSHRKERLDQIGYLLRAALAGVEWSEIEGGRRDRCF